MLGQNVAHRAVVRVGDKSPAGFTGLSVGRANSLAPGARDGTETDLAQSVKAGIFPEFAVHAHGVIGNGWFFAEEQGIDAGDEFIPVNGAARDCKIHRDDGIDRADIIRLVPCQLYRHKRIAVHPRADGDT